MEHERAKYWAASRYHNLICVCGFICALLLTPFPHLAGPRSATWPCWSPRCKRMPTRWRKTSSGPKSCWLWWEQTLKLKQKSLLLAALCKSNHPNCCLLPPGRWKWQERPALQAPDWDIRQAGRGWGTSEGSLPGRWQSQEVQLPTGQRDRERVSWDRINATQRNHNIAA